MRLGRPVKWIEDRIENLRTMSHGRDMYAEVEAAVHRDGRIEGLRAKIVADLGAYNNSFTQGVPVITAKMITGCYKIKNLEVEVLGVFTNKMATNAYRGAGGAGGVIYHREDDGQDCKTSWAGPSRC
jgi:carbon-monoxide dehydrogenase large subunit